MVFVLEYGICLVRSERITVAEFVLTACACVGQAKLAEPPEEINMF